MRKKKKEILRKKKLILFQIFRKIQKQSIKERKVQVKKYQLINQNNKPNKFMKGL